MQVFYTLIFTRIAWNYDFNDFRMGIDTPASSEGASSRQKDVYSHQNSNMVNDVMKFPILRLAYSHLAPFCDCKNVTVIFIRRHAVNFAELCGDDAVQTIPFEGTKAGSHGYIF